MGTVRYGIFRLAQIWTLVGDDGSRLGFGTRAAAMDAAESMIHLHRSSGVAAELLVQDELGFLRPVAPAAERLERVAS